MQQVDLRVGHDKNSDDYPPLPSAIRRSFAASSASSSSVADGKYPRINRGRSDRDHGSKNSFRVVDSASSLIANVDMPRVGFAADPPKLGQ